jgi:hypothetical protein
MIDPKVFEDLKVQHGDDLHLLTSREHEVVVRRPTQAEYKRFRANGVDPNKRDIAAESLLKTVLVYPDRKTFEALLDRYPALCEEFSDPLLEIVGLVNEA